MVKIVENHLLELGHKDVLGACLQLAALGWLLLRRLAVDLLKSGLCPMRARDCLYSGRAPRLQHTGVVLILLVKANCRDMFLVNRMKPFLLDLPAIISYHRSVHQAGRKPLLLRLRAACDVEALYAEQVLVVLRVAVGKSDLVESLTKGRGLLCLLSIGILCLVSTFLQGVEVVSHVGIVLLEAADLLSSLYNLRELSPELLLWAGLFD